MRISTVEGGFAAAHGALTTGVFFTGFALLMGADDAVMGILAAIPYLGQVCQLLSAYLTERTGKVKAVTLAGGAGGRLIWVFPIVLLFLPGLSLSFRIGALIVFFVLSYGLLYISYNSWTAWMSELIPERLRGRYFGARNVVVVIVALALTLAGGVVLDAFQRVDLERLGFAAIFAVAVVAAAASAVLLTKQPVLAAPASSAADFFRKLRAPLADANYRRVLYFFAAWNFAWGVPLAFWNVHMLAYLRMSYFQASLFNAILSLVSAVAYPVWGKITDRAGNKPVLAITAAAIGVLPLLWLAPRPGAIWPIWLIPFVAGSSWAGFNLAAFTFPLALAPRAARVHYVAVFGILTGAAAFVASTLGGFIAQAMAPYIWVIGGVEFINYHFLFALSAAGRLACLLILRRIRDERSAGVRAAVALVGDAVHDRLAAMTQFFPAWIRLRPRGSRGQD